jgi:hypothetical protein
MNRFNEAQELARVVGEDAAEARPLLIEELKKVEKIRCFRFLRLIPIDDKWKVLPRVDK